MNLKSPLTLEFVALLSLVILAFSIRLIDLDKNPAGFFVDEAIVGYEDYQLLKTGKDHFGNPWPLFFPGVSGYDNATPLTFYLTLPFVGVFGLNEFAVRLAGVFWSCLELILFYLLLKEFFPNVLAWLGTLMLALSPWHFHLSRLGMGHFTWTLTTILPLIFLMRYLKTEKKIDAFLMALFFAVATYGYTPARLLTPIFFTIALVYLTLAKRNLRVFALCLVIYLVILIPFINFHLNNPHSLERIKTTTEINPGNLNGKSLDLKKLFDHFAEKYPTHFSDDFLFLKGDTDYPGQFMRRHSISGLGLLYPYQKWLILLGFVWLAVSWLKFRRTENFFVPLLLLLSPVPDSLTNDATPFATRTYIEIIPLYFLATAGLFLLYQLGKKFLLKTNFRKTLAAELATFFVAASLFTLIPKFRANPLTTSDFWGWQYGPREIIAYFLSVRDNYDDLYLSGEFNGDLFINFYDPKNLCQNKCREGDFWRGPEIYKPERRQLFSLSPEYLRNSKMEKNFILKKTIYYPNGQTAFLIGELKKTF